MTFKEEVLRMLGRTINENKNQENGWDSVNKMIDRYLKKNDIIDANAKKLLVKIAETAEDYEDENKYSREDGDKFIKKFLIKYTSNTEKDKKELELLATKFYDFLG